MGALASKIQHEFDGEIRQRGREYYAAGAVYIHSSTEHSVSAKVTGQRAYQVKLELKAAILSVSCTCPFYLDRGPCKHVWATILEADIQKKLQPSPAIQKLSLDPGDFGGSDVGEDAEYDDDEDDDEERSSGRAPGAAARYPFQAKNVVPISAYQKDNSKDPEWKRFVAGVNRALAHGASGPLATKSAGTTGETFYAVNVPQTLLGNGFVVDLYYHERKANGAWGAQKPRLIERGMIASLTDPLDREVCALLFGGVANSGFSYYSGFRERSSRFVLSDALQEAILPLVARAGRLYLMRKEYGELKPLRYDEGPAWNFHLELNTDSQRGEYVLGGSLRRGTERASLAVPVMLNAGKWVFWQDHMARLNDSDAFPIIAELREKKEIRVPVAQGAEFVAMLQKLPRLPPLDAPEDLRVEEVRIEPRPVLKIKKPMYDPRNELRGELSFDYAGATILAASPERGVYHSTERKLYVRDAAAEKLAADKMFQLGFRITKHSATGEPELPPKQLPRVVAALVGLKWRVEAEGKLYRTPGEMKMTVASGIDWFELRADVDFGGAHATLPALLAALRKGETIVRLDDGSFGLLPEDWLKRYGILAGTGKAHDDHVRFTKSQAGVLDALLAAQPESSCDETFRRISEELRSFKSIKGVNPPGGFVGELREYQREGLGWLYFLQRFGFGGCLADDMGLGKTVMVLALLESRREMSDAGAGKAAFASDQLENAALPAGPSLVVVPRSLVFNWKQEAARFTPKLRVLDHTGTMREKDVKKFKDYDLVLTTYGTLRSDIVFVKDAAFDYVILDEAQTIKNADTGAAKATRLVQGAHRLCMSGTPVENHLNDLWSIFEFLNPGMLGTASVFQAGCAGVSGSAGTLNSAATTGAAGTTGREGEDESRALLARALRPFILRRTKAQVAKDLPEKTEQIIMCEMEPDQRKMYDELRDHYRKSLMGLVERDGINNVKIQILEALLRLRQAALHPGLIDRARSGEPSAKLDALLPQVEEVLEEGHKALVFSQFTSFLAILRSKLDAAHIPYEYLDGQTRDRQAKVDRFQNDPECKLFLISLKAGGVGLNLTAAEYVFLLDPWWNPAVEAQAIDRAHRIGQTRQVFAYRLIAKDTIEEKVVQLQQNKRDLANAIIGVDNSLISGLKREDLELLLG